MKRGEILTFGLWTLLVFLVLSCASTKLVHSWRNEKFSGPAFKKVMVAAVTRQQETRVLLEDAFVKRLQGAGVDAYACHKCIPDPAAMNRESLVQAVRDVWADSVLLLRLVSVESDTVEGRAEPRQDAIPSMGAYYDSAMTGYYDLPLSRQRDIVTMQAKFFDGKNGELLWSGSTRTVNPGQAGKEISEFTKLITDTLKGQKLI